MFKSREKKINRLIKQTKAKLKKATTKTEKCTNEDIYCNLPILAHEIDYHAKTENDLKPYLNQGLITLLDDGNIKYITGISKNKTGKKYIVVSIRGTDTFDNAVTDANIGLLKIWKNHEECKINQKVNRDGFLKGSGCKVHEGFNEYYSKFQNGLHKRLDELLTKNKIDHIIFTGHSLGGAVATIAAADCSHWLDNRSKKHVNISLITFGSPRVGN